jgi:hypothetical protein
MNNLTGSQKFWLIVLTPLIITSLIYSYDDFILTFIDTPEDLTGIQASQGVYFMGFLGWISTYIITFSFKILQKFNKYLDEKL